MSTSPDLSRHLHIFSSAALSIFFFIDKLIPTQLQTGSLPNINIQANATLFFPFSFARDASFAISSASFKEEYRSNNPLKLFACFKQSSAMSSCNRPNVKYDSIQDDVKRKAMMDVNGAIRHAYKRRNLNHFDL